MKFPGTQSCQGFVAVTAIKQNSHEGRSKSSPVPAASAARGCQALCVGPGFIEAVLFGARGLSSI